MTDGEAVRGEAKFSASFRLRDYRPTRLAYNAATVVPPPAMRLVMTRLVGETCDREPGVFDPAEWRGYRFLSFDRNQRNDGIARAEYGSQVAISSSEARKGSGPP